MQPQPGQPVIMGQTTQYTVGQQVMGGQPAQYVAATAAPMGTVVAFAPGQQKSKIAAGLLGMLIGALGIHNFYLGYTGKGIAQLLISVLSFGLLAFIPAIWGLIEGILILTGSINVDANGIPLSD